MPASLSPTVIVLFVGLLAVMLLAVLVLRQSARAGRVGARVQAVAGGFRAAEAPRALQLRRSESGNRIAGLLGRVGRVFGVPARRLPGMPAPLVVLAVALLAAVGATLLLGWVFGALAPPLTPPLWVVFSRLIYGYIRGRRLDRLYQQFPDALGTIIRAVRVGIPIAEGIRTVARDASQPTAGEFAQLADGLTLGLPLEEALRDMAERGGLAEYRFFATALILQAQTGGGLAETLDNLADVIRRRIGLRNRAVALASEARTSAAILAALPVVTGLLLAFINPSYIGALFAPDGRFVLAAAVLMQCGGLLIMRSIIKRSLKL